MSNFKNVFSKGHGKLQRKALAAVEVAALEEFAATGSGLASTETIAADVTDFGWMIGTFGHNLNN